MKYLFRIHTVSLLLYISACSEDIITKKELIGLDERSIILKLNKPTMTKEINVTKEIDLEEYQSNLYQIYPESKLGDTVRIRELFWKNDDYTEVVWLEKKTEGWKAVDHLKWSSNIQF